MSNRLDDIQTRLVAQLATIDGAGAYTNDLSATGRVFVANARPDGAPDLCVWLAQGEIASSREGAPLGMYVWTVTYGVAGFAPATADTPAARISAANGLLADLVACIDANRALNDGTRDLVHDIWLTQMESVDGAAIDFAGQGVCSFLLTLTWIGGGSLA